MSVNVSFGFVKINHSSSYHFINKCYKNMYCFVNNIFLLFDVSTYGYGNLFIERPFQKLKLIIRFIEFSYLYTNKFLIYSVARTFSLVTRHFYRSAPASYVTVISAINASASPSTVITRIRTTHYALNSSSTLPPCVLLGASVTGQTTEYRHKQIPLFMWLKLLEFHVPIRTELWVFHLRF